MAIISDIFSAIGVRHGVFRLLNIQRPCELFEFAVGKFGNEQIRSAFGGRRRLFSRHRHPFFFFPDVKLTAEEIFCRGFHERHERLAVVFVKSQHCGDYGDRKHKYDAYVKVADEVIDDETKSGAADEIGELFECERSEDFVFNLDKLWYLESHFSLTVHDMGRRGIFSLPRRQAGPDFAAPDLRAVLRFWPRRNLPSPPWSRVLSPGR